MELKKVQHGDPLRIPAPTFNTFVDAAQDFLNRRHNQGGPVQTPGEDGLILIRNDTGSDLDRFSVLGIDDSILIAPGDNLRAFKNQPAFVGVTPDELAHRGRFVILAEPLKDGCIGSAYVTGVCPVKLDVVDEDHARAEVKDGDTSVLQTVWNGSAQILWKEPGTGERWGVIRFPFEPPMHIRFDGTCRIDQASPGTSFPDATSMTNGQAAGSEERLLIHLAKPADLSKLSFASWALTTWLDFIIQAHAVGGVTSVNAGHIEIRPVTSDFDFTGTSITWNQYMALGPPVGDQIGGTRYMAWIQYEASLPLGHNFRLRTNVLDAVGTQTEHWWTVYGGPSTSVYGIELQRVCQPTGAGYPTYSQYSVEDMTAHDYCVWVRGA